MMEIGGERPSSEQSYKSSGERKPFYWGWLYSKSEMWTACLHGLSILPQLPRFAEGSDDPWYKAHSFHLQGCFA